MRLLAIVLILLATLSTAGQSGRVVSGTPAAAPAEPTVKQMFDEANGYIRARGTEFDSKKIPFSDRLFSRAKTEQRQLSAKFAAIAGIRKDLAGEDFYYFGMINWIAENLDGTVDALLKFIAFDGADPFRRQTARSIVVVALAKQKRLDEGELVLAEYLKDSQTKLTERTRMEGELAKAYQAKYDFARMAPHAAAGYNASKALLKEASTRSRGLDEILDAGMLMFEAYRGLGDQNKAEAALDDMRATAGGFESPSFYYYAVDQKIKYLAETGRKTQAMQFYQAAIATSAKDFKAKESGDDIVLRLKKRDAQYKLLGEKAPELPSIDQWFPGERKTLSQLKGKVVLLDFWATWCGPCFEAYPSLIEWQRDFRSDGLEIIGLTRYYGDINGEPAKMSAEIEFFKQFRAKEKLPYDIAVALGQEGQILYGATALPTAVLIDRKGMVRYIESGTSSTRLAEMREMILKLLAEK